MAANVHDPFDLGLSTRSIGSRAAEPLLEQAEFYRGGLFPPGELWREMRRLLDPVYWTAWEAAPGADKQFRESVRSAYNLLARRLNALAWSLTSDGLTITVAQGALWWCAYPEWEERGLFSRPQANALRHSILAWAEVDPSGHGWLPAAAGLTPTEYQEASATHTLPDRDALLGLATLRGHRLPRPEHVPIIDKQTPSHLTKRIKTGMLVA